MLKTLRRRNRTLLLMVLLLVREGTLAAADPAAMDADWPAWVHEQEALKQRIAAVNEGELTFIDPVHNAGVHHQAGRIEISERSLVDGWVVLEQCHENIDQVAEAQILFHPQRSRALEVISFRNIDAAYPEANTIQLRGIRGASRLCIRAESQALNILDREVFELRNGPFMRQFLDGYYPLQLSLEINFPPNLTLADFEPAVQRGFAVTSEPGRIHVEALFEGRLQTRFRFLSE